MNSFQSDPWNDYEDDDYEDEPVAPEPRPSRQWDLSAREMTDVRRDLFMHGSHFKPTGRDDVVGIDNVLEQIDDVIHWLRHSAEYQRFGARLEPGILFEGKPGTGKTLVSRYIATESGALFVDVRDFPHKGAFMQDSDVKALFDYARDAYATTQRPIVLFWDEFEGAVRDRASQGTTPEQAAAVSQLTAELDGVGGKNEGVLLIGCTNYASMVDDALLRPGRMGLHIEFNPPDREGKRLLLDYYLQHVANTGIEIDTDTLSHFFKEDVTASGIEEAIHEAWRVAVKWAIFNETDPVLSQAALVEVCLRRMIGPPPTFVTLAREAALRTAVHETGHALVALAYDIPLRLITIKPGRSNLGCTFTARVQDHVGRVSEKLAHLRIGCGSTIAERVCGIGQGVGAAADTKQVTEMAIRLVDEQGVGNESKFFNPLGIRDTRYYATEPALSQYLLEKSDRDVFELIRMAYADVEEMMLAIGASSLMTISERLVEAETMVGAEFAAMVESVIGSPNSYVSNKELV